MQKIKLTQGKFALIDDQDFELMSKYKWNFAKYATTGSGKKRIIMHRLILNTPKGMDTDHINGNKLDNRRENLRICTRSENSRNKGVLKRNKLGIKGVFYAPFRGRVKCWGAEICIKGRKIRKYFLTPDEAKEEYKNLAIKYHKEFARF